MTPESVCAVELTLVRMKKRGTICARCVLPVITPNTIRMTKVKDAFCGSLFIYRGGLAIFTRYHIFEHIET